MYAVTLVLADASSAFVFYALVGFYLFLLRLSTVQGDDLEALACEAVRNALDRAHICVKEAAFLMQLDESNLRKQLKREPNFHLSFCRMFRLPFLFWMHLWPEIILLVAKKRLSEIVADHR